MNDYERINYSEHIVRKNRISYFVIICFDANVHKFYVYDTLLLIILYHKRKYLRENKTPHNINENPFCLFIVGT